RAGSGEKARPRSNSRTSASGGLALAREFRDGSARAAGGWRRNTVVRRVRPHIPTISVTAGNRIGGKPTPVNGPGRRQHVDGGCYEWSPRGLRSAEPSSWEPTRRAIS